MTETLTQTSTDLRDPVPSSWIDHYASVLFGLVLLLAAALRFFRIDRVPLWTDELATIYFVARPFADFFSPEAMREPNPPLYGFAC